MSDSSAASKMKGGEFLLVGRAPDEIFTPEDFTSEYHAIAKTTREFWINDVVPNLDAMHHHDHAAGAEILRKSGKLGLTGVMIPEVYGGMEMDLTSMMVVAEGLSGDGSYAAWH